MISKNKSSKYAIVPIFIGLMIAAGLLVSLHLQAGNMKMVSTLKSLPQSAMQLWNGNVQADGSALNEESTTLSSAVLNVFKFDPLLGENNDQQKSKTITQKKSKIQLPTYVMVGSDTLKDRNGNKIYLCADQLPQYPGGVNNLITFLRKNLRYPQTALEKGIKGTVILSFVVNTVGEISNIRIIRSIGGGCDEEAVRIVKLMPKWKPGKQNGKVVPVQYTLPIKFVLQRDDRTKK